MATTRISVGFSYHGTTDGAAADDITLDAQYSVVQIVNRDATNNLAVVVAYGHTADTFATLAMGGEGTILLTPGASYTALDDSKSAGGSNKPTRVKVLSAVAAAYSIYGRLA